MLKAPPVPKRDYRNRALVQKELSQHVGGSGFQVARSLQVESNDQNNNTRQEERPSINKKKKAPVVEEEEAELDILPFVSDIHEVVDATPDVVIGEDVEIKGDFQYDGILHLYGRFEGRLVTDGDVYVGPKGVLKSNITTINRLYIDGGHVIGSLAVKQLAVRGKAIVRGEIVCKYMEVESEDCVIEAKVFVHPEAQSIADLPPSNTVSNKSIPTAVPTPVSAPEIPKVTVETSSQVSRQSSAPQLSPAEQALQAKVEAKERRKEAKRLQQEEALRRAHGLPPAEGASASLSEPVPESNATVSEATAAVPALNFNNLSQAAASADANDHVLRASQDNNPLEASWRSDVTDIQSEPATSPRRGDGHHTAEAFVAAPPIAEEDPTVEGLKFELVSTILPPTEAQRVEAALRDSAPPSPAKTAPPQSEGEEAAAGSTAAVEEAQAESTEATPEPTAAENHANAQEQAEGASTAAVENNDQSSAAETETNAAPTEPPQQATQVNESREAATDPTAAEQQESAATATEEAPPTVAAAEE